MLIYSVGFIALYRFLLLAKSQFGIVSALARIGMAATIITTAVLFILQAVDGVSLKMAVDRWIAATVEEQVPAFYAAESIRWIEIGINSIARILQGAVVMVFGAAIVFKGGLVPRWVGAIGIPVGIVTLMTGLTVSYIGFATGPTGLMLISYVSYVAWIVIVSVYMWRKSNVQTIEL